MASSTDAKIELCYYVGDVLNGRKGYNCIQIPFPRKSTKQLFKVSIMCSRVTNECDDGSTNN
jgi:hypothetical protein